MKALRVLVFGVAVAAALVACSRQVKRINPPAVTIQQVVVQPDGRWKLTLRLQNYSTVPTRFGTLKLAFDVAGANAAQIDFDTALDVPPSSADVVDTTIAVNAKAPTGEFDYTLNGTLDSTEPKGHFPIERKSRLSPVPGLPNTFR